MLTSELSARLAQTSADGDARYPWELGREVVARDGTRLQLRAIRADDAPRLMALHSRLSAQTVYQRFFSALRRLPTDWARYLAEVDYRRRLALVVERDGPEGIELVGVGRYEPTGSPGRAEVAFVIEDRWQGRGLGSALFDALLAAAEPRGIHEFSADVLMSNTRMLDLIARRGRILERRVDAGVVSLVFRRRGAPAVGSSTAEPGAALAGLRAPVAPAGGSRRR